MGEGNQVAKQVDHPLHLVHPASGFASAESPNKD